MTRTLFLPWIAVLLWMACLFFLSHQPVDQSDHLSSGISDAIISALSNILPLEAVDMGTVNHIVRKNAHFFAYLILGLLVINAAKHSNIHGYRRLGLALLVCILFAASDEVHQLFVPGRGGQVKDVLIDSSGAITGSFFWMLREKTAVSRKRKRLRRVLLQNNDIDRNNQSAFFEEIN